MTSRKLKAGKKHKLYKMRGCSSKKNCKYLGGSAIPPNNMMNSKYYPNTNPPTPSNNQLLLSGSLKKGGCVSCGKLWGGKGGASDTFFGKPWTPTNLPSVNNANHYALNTFNNGDVQLETKVLGNPPFSKGGRRIRKSSKTISRKNSKTKRKTQKGGNLSNFIFQDLVNLGRNLSFGAGSSYNTLIGTHAPVNPMPWQQSQLVSKLH
jgi:hypothetical protein